MEIQPQSYLTDVWYNPILLRLKQLYQECDRIKHLNSAAIVLMSIEILQSLNTQSLPVGANLYHFRKSIVTEFHKKFKVDINPSLPVSLEINVATDVDTLVTEYHIRIYNCLKVVLGHIAHANIGEPPCQNTRRSITG